MYERFRSDPRDLAEVNEPPFRKGPRGLGEESHGPPHSLWFDDPDRPDGVMCNIEFRNDLTGSLAVKGFGKGREARGG